MGEIFGGTITFRNKFLRGAIAQESFDKLKDTVGLELPKILASQSATKWETKKIPNPHPFLPFA